jgi:hypothetical protein
LRQQAGTRRPGGRSVSGKDAEQGKTMTVATPDSPPERDQIISVRSRQWIVNDVGASMLPAPAFMLAIGGPQHLLTRSSVEDDGLGEDLQIMWEIELTASVIENVALPEPAGLDRPNHLNAGCRPPCSISDGVGDSQILSGPPATTSAHGEAL